MKAFTIISTAMLSTMLAPITAVAQTSSTEIQIGQVIGNEPGQVINGWTHVGGGLYEKRTWENPVTIESLECCYTMFQKNRTHLLAITKAVARKPTGGVEAERITLLKKVVRLPGEEIAECSLLWLKPIMSFSSGIGRPVRSFIYDGSQIVEYKWIESPESCSTGDD